MKKHAVSFGVLYIILSCMIVIVLAFIMPMEDTPLMTFLINDSVVNSVARCNRMLLSNSIFFQVLHIGIFGLCLEA